MNSTSTGFASVRAAVIACALWTVICLVLLGFNALRNPMKTRKNELNARLTKIVSVPEDLLKPGGMEVKGLRLKIVEKEALWKPLVAAPIAAPAPEAAPNLLEKLQGVIASRRDQIRLGDSVKIKLYMSPEDKRGRWASVGDKINGLTITEIKPDSVVFSLEQNGKQFTAELPRR